MKKLKNLFPTGVPSSLFCLRRLPKNEKVRSLRRSEAKAVEGDEGFNS